MGRRSATERAFISEEFLKYHRDAADKFCMSVSELSPSAISVTSASTAESAMSAIDQLISLHSDSVGARQAGRHVEFPAAVHEVLTSLRSLTGIPNWALTRQRSDGSLTILSPARRPQTKPTANTSGETTTSEASTAKFLSGESVASSQNDRVAARNSPIDDLAPVEPISTGAFVLDRRKHQPVFLVDILDEERHNTFGNLVGYRTGKDLRNETPIAPADAALAGLLASMLASVLAQDRRNQMAQRAEERIAYPERDAVTGCLERSAWIRLLESEALRLHRFDDEGLLVAVRIDHLAEIKRSHGIEAAEELRREVSYALHSTTTSSALVAHLTDDSYASLLCSTDPTAELRAFRSRVELLELPVTITVGQRLPGERSLYSAQRRAGLVSL
jgi:GGDEF domain-containing protein